MEKQTPKDQPLFGPVDQVVNTLEMEASWVKGEIKRCWEAINRKEDEIEQLKKRQDAIDESLKFVRESEKKRQEAEGGPLAYVDGVKLDVAAGLKDVEKKARTRKGKKS